MAKADPANFSGIHLPEFDDISADEQYSLIFAASRARRAAERGIAGQPEAVQGSAAEPGPPLPKCGTHCVFECVCGASSQCVAAAEDLRVGGLQGNDTSADAPGQGPDSRVHVPEFNTSGSDSEYSLIFGMLARDRAAKMPVGAAPAPGFSGLFSRAEDAECRATVPAQTPETQPSEAPSSPSSGPKLRQASGEDTVVAHQVRKEQCAEDAAAVAPGAMRTRLATESQAPREDPEGAATLGLMQKPAVQQAQGSIPVSAKAEAAAMSRTESPECSGGWEAFPGDDGGRAEAHEEANPDLNTRKLQNAGVRKRREDEMWMELFGSMRSEDGDSGSLCTSSSGKTDVMHPDSRLHRGKGPSDEETRHSRGKGIPQSFSATPTMSEGVAPQPVLPRFASLFALSRFSKLKFGPRQQTDSPTIKPSPKRTPG